MPGAMVRNSWRGVGRTRQQSDIVVTAPASWQASAAAGLESRLRQSMHYGRPSTGVPVVCHGKHCGHCSRCRRSQPEGILPGLLFDIVTALSGCAKSPNYRSDRDTACDQPAPEHFGTKGFVVRARQRINSCKGDEGAGNAGSHDIYDGRYPCLGTICHRFKWILAPVSGRRWTFHEHERATDLSRTDCADQEDASDSRNI